MRQGLRSPKTSADTDVFVSPSNLDQMLQGLRGGWRERPVDPDNRPFPKHSVTVDHPDWPCSIDVHFRFFPGMEGTAAECFEVMWANTEYLELAGPEVRFPSPALGILILWHCMLSDRFTCLRTVRSSSSWLTSPNGSRMRPPSWN